MRYRRIRWFMHSSVLSKVPGAQLARKAAMLQGRRSQALPFPTKAERSFP